MPCALLHSIFCCLSISCYCICCYLFVCFFVHLLLPKRIVIAVGVEFEAKQPKF